MNQAVTQSQHPAQHPSATRADTIITNAHVFSASEQQPFAEAVAISGDRILAVGTEADILNLRTASTQMIDAGGHTVMPGIIDSHFHLLWGAHDLANVQLGGMRGLDTIRERVQAFKREHPNLTMIRGSSLGYDVLEGNTRLTRQHLDSIEPDIPLVLVAFDFHNAWCNTAALKQAGILEGAIVPSNASVVMGADGLASGELREFEAMDLVFRLIPEPSRADSLRLLKEAIALAHRYGITSLHNMNGDMNEFEIYRQLEQAGNLTVRLYVPFRMYPHMPDDRLQEAIAMRDSYQSAYLKAGAFKLFMDGVVESFTAFMVDPYVNDPSTRGDAIFSAEHVNRLAQQADAAGLQIAVHAIGDAAIRRTLDAYAYARAQNGARDSRHRIEHIEFLHPDDLPRFTDLGVIASMQPYHCTRTEIDYLTNYLNFIPQNRHVDAFRWNGLRACTPLAFGSDFPVVSMNPFLGIDAAVNRQRWDGKGASPEALTLEQTLTAYTRTGAYTEFAEADKGQLHAGMLADVAILTDNLFDIATSQDPSQLAKVAADVTLSGGTIVYER